MGHGLSYSIVVVMAHEHKFNHKYLRFNFVMPPNMQAYIFIFPLLFRLRYNLGCQKCIPTWPTCADNNFKTFKSMFSRN